MSKKLWIYLFQKGLLILGNIKGQKFGDIKDDISYLEWLVSIGKISIEDFNLLTTI